MTLEKLTKQFHDTYERLAPEYKYDTRPETRTFCPTSPNGKLMIAVVKEVVLPYVEAEKSKAHQAGKDEAVARVSDIERGRKWMQEGFNKDRKGYLVKKALTEAHQAGYADGYKQGKFDAEVTAEYGEPETLQDNK